MLLDLDNFLHIQKPGGRRSALCIWRQMPKGVPVATVAIGNAANAGLLAARILVAADPALRQRMERYQADMKQTVLDKAARMEAVGWEDY